MPEQTIRIENWEAIICEDYSNLRPTPRTPYLPFKFQTGEAEAREVRQIKLSQEKTLIAKMMKQVLSVLVCSTLLAAGAPAETLLQEQASQDASQPATTQASSTTPSTSAVALETADQLDALVAPIALYPDALVAQVLAAASYPDQVAYASDWLQQNSGLTGTALANAVDQQNWDPSVKALTQFSSVLNDLAKNLSWTSSLGQAFVNQQSDVMAAVQTMRAKAQAAGTLQSSSQITVTQQSPSTIVIQPANPDVVYVPQYNPTVVYGTPYVVPYYTPPVTVATAAVSFGGGVAVGAVLGGGGFVGGGFGWGFGAWGCNWGGGGSVSFNNSTYINKTVINRNITNNYNGRPWGPNNPNGYRPGSDTHYGPNGAYHPNGYYGPNGAWHSDGSVNHAGGATGSENHAWYGANGTYHPDGNYKPGQDTHYGPNGGYHPNGYFGPDGGYHPDKPGTNPHDQPNGGHNGDHGLIGGNGGVRHDFNNQPNDARLNDQRGPGDQRQGGFDRGNSHVNQPRSYMSGNGDRDRAAADRGRSSMHQAAMRQPRPQHQRHSSAPHNSGGRRR